MSMYRIVGRQVVDGKQFGGLIMEGEHDDSSWDVRIFEVNGHREISARTVVNWSVVAEYEDRHKLPCFDNEVPLTEDELEERRAKALERNAKRAQTMCRRVIKAEAFDELLTLTYRENQGDRDLCKVHFKEWVRRMKRALGNFRFCASFEKQKRGAMHVHIATQKLPEHGNYKGVKVKAWQLGTKIWRAIVGTDNGMCFVGGATKNGGRRRNLSLAKMASYVSKYIMKDYADAPENSNRYSRSNGMTIPKSVVVRLTGCTMAEMIAAVFTCADADVIVSHRVSAMNSSYWLCTEPNPDLLRA